MYAMYRRTLSGVLLITEVRGGDNSCRPVRKGCRNNFMYTFILSAMFFSACVDVLLREICDISKNGPTLPYNSVF